MAVILAAGQGMRLRPHTVDRPKSLVEVGGRTLLEHQIRALHLAGVRRIQVITGFMADAVRERCGARASCAFNPAYASSDSFRSLGCTTLDPGVSGMLVLNGDVLLHPRLVYGLVRDARANVLLCDFRGALGEEETKVVVDGSRRIVGISKAIDPALAHGENVGVLKLCPDVARRMIAMSRNGVSERFRWVPDAIHAIRDEHPFWALPVGDLPWIEVDFAGDLALARERVYPQIAAALWSRRPPGARRPRRFATSAFRSPRRSWP